MRRGNNSWWIWLILFIILGGGIGALLPLFLIIAVVVAIAMASVSSYKKQDSFTQNFSNFTTYKRNGSYQRSESESSKLAKINMYLRKYFRTRNSVTVIDNIELRLREEKFASLASLDVYRNNSLICSFNDYQRRYPESYSAIIEDLLRLSNNAPIQDEVFDAEVVENSQQQEQPKQNTTKQTKNSQYYIDEINGLNNDIPDEEISNGLYETCSLLKQIQTLEEKFPNSKDKLKKLYEYYLPILTKILKQYRDLQYAKTDPSYEETKNKLTRTIHLINDAMSKIISSMTDEDFINLSADISTLEAVLKKDGLTEEGTISATKSKGE
jgi:hypothetical protein